MKNVDIKYTIEFYSDWHCGSGLSAGADLDMLVIKDKNQLPFIPGKTIKGLVREAIEELDRLSDYPQKSLIRKAFGYTKQNEEGNEIISERGECFFSNAALNEELANAIFSEKMSSFLYRSLSSTKISSEGVAQDHHLRKIQVTIPCVLEGEVLNVPYGLQKEMKQAFMFIKRLGQNRNRGLGRCNIIIKENTKEVSNETNDI